MKAMFTILFSEACSFFFFLMIEEDFAPSFFPVEFLRVRIFIGLFPPPGLLLTACFSYVRLLFIPI